MKPSLTLVLLQAAVEREDVVRRQNEQAERAMLDRWRVKPKKKSRKKSLDNV